MSKNPSPTDTSAKGSSWHGWASLSQVVDSWRGQASLSQLADSWCGWVILSPFVDLDTSSPRKTACNYTRVVREQGPAEETFVIDPSIRVNESLLPSLTEAQRMAEGGKNNLYVKTQSGDVDMTIELKQDQVKKALFGSLPGKVKFVAESGSGDIVIRLKAPSKDIRSPIHLTVNAQSGSVFVLLPRSIRGPINATADKRPVVVSGDLSNIVNTTSEEGSTRKLVIGEMGGPWNLTQKDEIFLTAGRRVFLQYEDEEFVKPIVKPVVEDERGCIIC